MRTVIRKIVASVALASLVAMPAIGSARPLSSSELAKELDATAGRVAVLQAAMEASRATPEPTPLQSAWQTFKTAVGTSARIPGL